MPANTTSNLNANKTAHIVGIGTAVPPVRLLQEDAVELSATISQLAGDDRSKLRRLYRGSKIQSRHMAVLTTMDNSHGNGNGDGSGVGNGNGNGNGEYNDAELHAGDDWNVPFYHRPADRADRGPLTGDRIEQYETYAANLAVAAAQQSLNRAALDAKQIDHLVTVSCTGFAAPGVDIALFDRLGLRADARRTNVGFMGCHGVFNGLRVADAMVHRYGGNALVCAVELCSVHFAYGDDLDKLIANSLFADGAGAAVVSPSNSQDVETTHETNSWKLRDNASCVLANTTDLMTWRIGDHGFEMTLSAGLPDCIRDNLRDRLTPWLASHNLSPDSIQAWAIHPGGPRVLQAVSEAMSLDDAAMQASYDVLEQYGNMSSPTVLFILERLKALGRKGPCVAIGFGPGLTIEAMLLD